MDSARMIRFPIAALALFVLAAQVQAGDRISHSTRIFPRLTTWTESLSVPQFDPAQGTLTAVHVTLTTDSISTLSFESPDASPQVAEVTLDCVLELRRPDSSVLASAASSTSRSDFLTPFDGNIDFAGPSGRTYPDIAERRTQVTTITAGSDLALFTGTGTFTPDLSGFDSCIGLCGCPLVIQCTNSLGAFLVITYEYDPKPTVEHRFTIPQTTTSWNQVVDIPAFDPSLGKLTALIVDVQGELSGTHGLESMDAAPLVASYTVDGALSVLLPDLTNGASAAMSDADVFLLSAFDGNIDFAGPSGTSGTHADERTARSVFTDPAVLAQVVGQGNVPLTVNGDSVFTPDPPINLVSLASTTVGGSVTVGYVFEPCSSVAHTDFIFSQPLNWADSVSLPEFDPALGELRGVLLTLRGENDVLLGYENQDGVPNEYFLESTVDLEVRRPDASTLIAERLRVFAREAADPADGTVDFAGPGGGTVPGLRDVSDEGVLLDSAADKALFIGSGTGTGTVTLPVIALGLCSPPGPGSPIHFCQNDLQVFVTARYLYDPPAGTPSCFGVGCPCANNDPAAGCANSTGSGALLTGYGVPSVSCDTLVLSATGMPAHQNGLFYMGNTQVSNVLFDGRQCALGVTFRFLDSIQSSGAIGRASFRDTVASSGGLIMPGSTWYYHFWHRDTAGSPCGTGANLTNLLGVTYLP